MFVPFSLGFQKLIKALDKIKYGKQKLKVVEKNIFSMLNYVGHNINIMYILSRLKYEI